MNLYNYQDIIQRAWPNSLATIWLVLVRTYQYKVSEVYNIECCCS